MHTRKAPDFWGLHKNMNCEVPLRTNFYRTPPRSSHQRCSMKKGVLRNFTKFTGKHLCQTLFFSKVAGCNFFKKRFWHKCFPVNFVKFLRKPYLQNTSERLTSRSSRLQMLFKLGVLEALFKKLGIATLLKKDSSKGVFM